jgi:hypothetical protein
VLYSHILVKCVLNQVVNCYYVHSSNILFWTQQVWRWRPILPLKRGVLNFNRLDNGKVHKVNEFSDLICIKWGRLKYIHKRARFRTGNVLQKVKYSSPFLSFKPYTTKLNPVFNWVILVAGKVFTHNCNTGKLSALIQCWNIVCVERYGFQRCQT